MDFPTCPQRFSFHGHRFEILRRARNQILALRVTPEGAGEVVSSG